MTVISVRWWQVKTFSLLLAVSSLSNCSFTESAKSSKKFGQIYQKFGRIYQKWLDAGPAGDGVEIW